MYLGLCNKKDKKEIRQQLGVTSEHQKSYGIQRVELEDNIITTKAESGHKVCHWLRRHKNRKSMQLNFFLYRHTKETG